MALRLSLYHLIYDILFIICLDLDPFSFIMFGTLCTSCTWMSVFFTILWKFPVLFLQIIFSFLSSSKMLIIHIYYTKYCLRGGVLNLINVVTARVSIPGRFQLPLASLRNSSGNNSVSDTGILQSTASLLGVWNLRSV